MKRQLVESIESRVDKLIHTERAEEKIEEKSVNKWNLIQNNPIMKKFMDHKHLFLEAVS